MASADRFVVREATAEEMPLIRPLWEDLYIHQNEHGLLSGLSGDGFERWSRSLTPVLGRFACLLVADLRGQPVGFLAGRIKSPTPPFEPTPIGFISEVFAAASHRGSGIGRELLRCATDWFSNQGIVRLELQVLSGNIEARQAYRHMGWQEELVQMVYRIGDLEHT